MKVEEPEQYFARCDQPGCMSGYLGWNEPCERCNGTGWIVIPHVLSGARMLTNTVVYLAFVVIAGFSMWLLFR